MKKYYKRYIKIIPKWWEDMTAQTNYVIIDTTNKYRTIKIAEDIALYNVDIIDASMFYEISEEEFKLEVL